MLMSMCELHFLRGDLEEAERWARQAFESAGRASEPVNVGGSHVWLGRNAEAGGDQGKADAEFRSAFELFQDPASNQRLSHAHALYAEILERRGDLGAAVQHLKRALATQQSGAEADSRAATA